MTTPVLTLNNGVKMPALGFGVFQTPPDETAEAVRTALETGYRHIDTAAAYQNEKGVGEGLRRSGVPREEVFLETKIWVSDYGYEETLHAFDKSATKLGVEQIDLLILHQPMPQHFERTREAYRALETLLERGSVRAIGVSNAMPHHVAALLETASIVPAINQVELHPYFTQPDVQAADSARGTLTQAWSPIGGITFYAGYGEDRRSVLEDAVIGEIAGRLGATPAQVMLAWHRQEGRSAIPKSTNPGRIAENFASLQVELTADDLAAIGAQDAGTRGGPEPDGVDPSTWGLEIPEA